MSIPTRQITELNSSIMKMKINLLVWSVGMDIKCIRNTKRSKQLNRVICLSVIYVSNFGPLKEMSNCCVHIFLNLSLETKLSVSVAHFLEYSSMLNLRPNILYSDNLTVMTFISWYNVHKFFYVLNISLNVFVYLVSMIPFGTSYPFLNYAISSTEQMKFCE